MKAMTSPSTSRFHTLYKATTGSASSSDSESSSSIRKGRVIKSCNDRRERRRVLEKLQKMVPTAQEGDSQLKLLQDIMDYIVALQRQLEDDLADSENRHLDVNLADLSEMFARFSTKTTRLPLRSGRQLTSH